MQGDEEKNETREDWEALAAPEIGRRSGLRSDIESVHGSYALSAQECRKTFYLTS
jgi:hypothetical protein